jgi:hypothetical protein
MCDPLLSRYHSALLTLGVFFAKLNRKRAELDVMAFNCRRDNILEKLEK